MKNKDDFAVIVGVSKYAEDRFNLSSPQDDAKAIEKWLKCPFGGNLPQKNVKTVISELGGGSASGVDIFNMLQEAEDFSHTNNNARRLYFYFSGHGFSNGPSDILLCHSDMSTRQHGNIPSRAIYNEFLAECGRYKEILLWLDCCRDHSLRTRPGVLNNICNKPMHADDQIVRVSYATSNRSSAYVASENSKSGLSIYTEVLLEGLKYSVDSNTNNVTWNSLKKYLKRQLPKRAAEYNRNQLPRFDELNDSDENALVLNSQPQKISVTVTFANSISKATFKQSGEVIEEISEFDTWPFHWNLKLSPGLYKLETNTGGSMDLDIEPHNKVFSYE